ncbi:MAG TPA: prepilin peptidase [Longimicrobiales bacterium]|nr:prepilin peptidase [Longimicrobiales bacterium]
MTTGWAAVAGIFGAALGSFLNVCVHRWPADQSVVSPRSRCPGCGAAIAGYDNIPIVSWLLLRGRCRRCAAPISVQYPLVEIAVAAVWAGSVLWLGPRIEALRIAVFLTILLGIALTDARHYLIPDEFSLGGLGVGLAFAALPGGFPMTRAVLGAAVGFALLWGIAFLGEKAFRKPAMGGGDIKMMAMVGAFVGTQGVFLTMFLGALAGALIFGPISVKTGKLVPFGIFLAVGAAITAVWGPAVVEWYLSTFL